MDEILHKCEFWEGKQSHRIWHKLRSYGSFLTVIFAFTLYVLLVKCVTAFMWDNCILGRSYDMI